MNKVVLYNTQKLTADDKLIDAVKVFEDDYLTSCVRDCLKQRRDSAATVREAADWFSKGADLTNKSANELYEIFRYSALSYGIFEDSECVIETACLFTTLLLGTVYDGELRAEYLMRSWGVPAENIEIINKEAA